MTSAEGSKGIVTIRHGEHTAGTKFYVVMAVCDSANPEMSWSINRWGKVGALGDCKVIRHSHSDHAHADMKIAARSKEGRGYVFASSTTLVLEDMKEADRAELRAMAMKGGEPGLISYLQNAFNDLGGRRENGIRPKASKAPEKPVIDKSATDAMWGTW